MCTHNGQMNSSPKSFLYSHQRNNIKNAKDWIDSARLSTQHFGFGVQSEFIDLALIEF